MVAAITVNGEVLIFKGSIIERIRKRDFHTIALGGSRAFADGNTQLEGIEYHHEAGISLLVGLIVTTNSAESLSARNVALATNSAEFRTLSLKVGDVK
jgi:hypothetical protein